MSSPKPFSKRRIVVVGSAGRMGQLMVRELAIDHQVIGLTRMELDLASPNSIRAALEPLEYDCLIIPGALTGVDYCETHEEEAFAINAEGPRLLAEISAAKGAHVTYISTDMVFNGAKDRPYDESDAPDPISVYGASKLKGEEEVLAMNPANLVVRVSWLYGPGKAAFPEWIIGEACKKTDVTLPGNKICCPTYTLDAIQFLKALLFNPNRAAASGVFHFCNSNPCSWMDWGQFCVDTAKEAGLPVIAEQITPVDVASVAAFVAKRPINSAMNTMKLTEVVGIVPRDWKIALREYLLQSSLFASSRE